MGFIPIIVNLESPLLHGDEEITELVFGREMNAGDLQGDIKVGLPTYDEIRMVASKICGVPTPILKKMPWRDFSKVVGVVMDFFNGSHLTGEPD